MSIFYGKVAAIRLSLKQNTTMQLVNSSVLQHLPHSTTTAWYVSSYNSYPSPGLKIAPYFGRAENSSVIGEKLSGMLKCLARQQQYRTLPIVLKFRSLFLVRKPIDSCKLMSHFIKLNILTNHWRKILRLLTHGKRIMRERRNEGPNEVVRLPFGADMY